MKFYGITDVANRLMESYLRNRYHRVNDYSSTWKEVQHGVPQGSVLGPLRFLIYINDLSKSISDKSILYVPAANLTLYRKGVYYSGIKIYNHLSTTIKNLSDDKNKFQIALKKFLSNNSFYSLEEYFNT
jgi:hypothetical protein